MQSIILILHILAAAAIITLVLLQYGKGADVGASFGSGASHTMFGSQGHMPFLMKLTAILAAIFFLTSLTLNYMSTRQVHRGDEFNFQSQTPSNTQVPTDNKQNN